MQSGKAGYAPIRNADKHRHSGASMGTSSSLSTRIQIATGPRIQEKTSDVIGRAMNNVTPSLPVQHNRCPTEPRRTTVSCTLARTRKRPKESLENAMRLEARLSGACAPCCRVSHSGQRQASLPDSESHFFKYPFLARACRREPRAAFENVAHRDSRYERDAHWLPRVRLVGDHAWRGGELPCDCLGYETSEVPPRVC